MELTAQCSPGEVEIPPIRSRMEHRRERLQKELDKIDEAIKLMEENPKLSALMNIVSQLHV